jgi:hypothetical protein
MSQGSPVRTWPGAHKSSFFRVPVCFFFLHTFRFVQSCSIKRCFWQFTKRPFSLNPVLIEGIGAPRDRSPKMSSLQNSYLIDEFSDPQIKSDNVTDSIRRHIRCSIGVPHLTTVMMLFRTEK